MLIEILLITLFRNLLPNITNPRQLILINNLQIFLNNPRKQPPTQLLPINPFNINTVEDWRAVAKTVLSRLTVDELGRIKAAGVTFGALYDQEREAVGSAASALIAGAVKENGELTGRFNISESKVKSELEKIMKYAEIDFERRTGQTYEEFKNAATLPAEDLAEINESLGVSNFTPGLYYSNQ